jgi:hypothetical protein
MTSLLLVCLLLAPLAPDPLVPAVTPLDLVIHDAIKRPRVQLHRPQEYFIKTVRPEAGIEYFIQSAQPPRNTEYFIQEIEPHRYSPAQRHFPQWMEQHEQGQPLKHKR